MRGEKGEMQARVILTFYHLNPTREAILPNVFQNGSNSTRDATPPEKGNFFLFHLLLYWEVTYKNNYPMYTISKKKYPVYTNILKKKYPIYTNIFFICNILHIIGMVEVSNIFELIYYFM
jgi:hypothetical protein